MEIDKITTTPEERQRLLAELNAKLSAWDAETATWAAESAKLKTEHEAQQRRFDAERLVRELYGGSFGHDELCVAVEHALAELSPAAQLDDAARIKLRRRHESFLLVKRIAELKGPMSAETESQLLEKLQRAMAATAATAPWEPTKQRKSKS
jgi:hypothetical protein